MGFLDYDVELRKIICSTNAVESLNAHYRRAGKPEDTSRSNKPRSSASTLVTRSLDRPDAAKHAGSPVATAW